jgi:hypothetical protein
MDQDLLVLAEQAGIYIAGAEGFQLPGVARSTRLAMDAQPSLVTQSNAGIPSYLTVYVDPKLIEVLVSPMKAAVVVGNEVKKGDWLMDTAVFPVVESTGETSSYGDYSENGRAGVNTNFPQRQSYHYQVITNWGERELERAGLAKIDWANRTNIASVLTLNKFQNLTYFFGVAGLQNYGLLNAPALPASIDPINQSGAILWADKDALEVYADIQALFAQLQTQANGLVDLETKMTLAMSPVSQVSLTKATQFNVNVMTLLKTNFPNMRIETAPEYATASGNLLQLFPDDLEGQRTVDVAFTEKLRAHPVKVELSSFKQKKSQGTWGAIIYRPILIASMIGI